MLLNNNYFVQIKNNNFIYMIFKLNLKNLFISKKDNHNDNYDYHNNYNNSNNSNNINNENSNNINA